MIELDRFIEIKRWKLILAELSIEQTSIAV